MNENTVQSGSFYGLPDNGAKNRGIISKYSDYVGFTNQRGYNLYYNGAIEKFQLGISTLGTSVNFLTSSNETNTGTFYHLAATYSAYSETKICVNGNCKKSKSDVGKIFKNTSPLFLGSQYDPYYNTFSSGFLNFRGIIDDVKIYNRVLSDQEIAQQARIAGF